MFNRLFNPRPSRPTPHERRQLTLALLATGDHSEGELRWLFHWAADPANEPALDLVLEGRVAVDVDGCVVRLGRCVEKAPWVMDDELAEAIA